MYGRARGAAVEQLSERCARATVQEPRKKAEKVSLIMMELMWGIKRAFRHEVLNASAKGALEEECESEILNSLTVHVKDATKGPYRLPPGVKVQRRSLGKGRKLRDVQQARGQKPNSIEALVGIPNTAGEESQGASTWIPKKVREWLQVLDLLAVARGQEAGRTCKMCPKEAVNALLYIYIMLYIYIYIYNIVYIYTYFVTLRI